MMPCINWGQQHLRAAALSTAEDGSVSHEGGTHRVIGTHSQSGQRVHSGLLDVCWVSEEFWLDAFAPADWKLVLPSAWGMERPPGAGLPSPNVLEGSFGFPWCSSRKKPSLMQSDVTPPQPVKETSLHVHSCHRALQQCAGGVCKKRWMQGSVGGRVFWPCAALCCQLGRSTERLRAEASGQNEKLPHAGTFYVHLLQVCALHWLYLGMNPHHWKSSCAARS